MRFTDDENGAGHRSDTPDDNPAADFGRRRVSRILNREKPRFEQNDFVEFDVGNLVFDMMKNSRFKGETAWSFGRDFRGGVDVYCPWRRTLVHGGLRLGLCWKLRKGPTANLNSRYLGRPF